MRYKDEENERRLWDSYLESKKDKDMTTIDLLEYYYPLVEKYSKLYMRMRGIGQDKAVEVYDICMDTMFKTIKKFDINSDNTFETYYSKKLKGYILNMFRDSKKLPILFEDNEELNIQDMSLETNFSIEMISLLERYLDEDEIKIIRLYYVDGYLNKEIALMLNMTEKNVCYKHQTILHKLKNKLSEQR